MWAWILTDLDRQFVIRPHRTGSLCKVLEIEHFVRPAVLSLSSFCFV